MTDVPVETLSWGGVDVANWAIHAIDLSELLKIPGRRGENITVAGRDGAQRVARKNYEPRDFSIDFWVRGCLPDGTVPSGRQSAQFYKSMDLLAQLCTQDVAPMVHTLPDGTKRVLPVEVLTEIDPKRWLAGMLGKVKITFGSADAWWRSVNTITATRTLSSGQTSVLTEFDGMSGRIDDAVVGFALGSSTGNNPVLTQVETGVGIGYRQAFTASQRLTVGDYDWTATGFTFLRQQLVTDPRNGAWWVLDPVPGSAPTVRLDLTGGGPMQVSVAARMSWGVG